MKNFATMWLEGLTIRSVSIAEGEDKDCEDYGHNSYAIRLECQDSNGVTKVAFIKGDHDAGPDFFVQTPEGELVEVWLSDRERYDCSHVWHTVKRTMAGLTENPKNVDVCVKCWKRREEDD